MYSIGVEPISSCATFLLCLSFLSACGEATGYECSTATSDDSTSAASDSLADLPDMVEVALYRFMSLQ